jgi:perosamine synthetase
MSAENIPFYVPWITKADKKSVVNSLSSRWLTGGPRVAEFEKMFAAYVGSKYALAVNSCTAALHLSMRSLNLKPGDEVIVPVFTFAATANAPLFCNAKPVFVDVDEKTFNISIKDVSEKITRKTKAIIPVHYGGQPCDMKELQEIASDHKLQIVEDCAHSLGAKYRGQQTGTFGVAGCFSFYPTKIITTLEGGMIATNEPEVAKRLRMLREHGMDKAAPERETRKTWRYDVVDVGYNYRLTDVQAALGISQLQRVDDGIKRRMRAAKYYTKQLSECLQLVLPFEAADRSHIHHLYTVRVKKTAGRVTRDTLFEKLIAAGIQPSVHYTPLHLMSYYKQFLDENSKFPIADALSEEVLSLPLYPTLSQKSQLRINSLITEILNQAA